MIIFQWRARQKIVPATFIVWGGRSAVTPEPAATRVDAFRTPTATNVFTPTDSGYVLPKGEFPPYSAKPLKKKKKPDKNLSRAMLLLLLEDD